MKMICHICLRTDRNLQIIEQKLHLFIAELIQHLCSFPVDKTGRYCLECIHMLRKFHEFRKKCILANENLNNWTKRKGLNKKPISLLYNTVPQTCLNFSKLENCKVYFYQEPTEAPITVIGPSIVPSNYPRIVIDPCTFLPIACNTQNVTDVKQEEEIADCVENDEPSIVCDFTECDVKNPLDIKIETIKSEIFEIESEEDECDIKDCINADLNINSNSSDDFEWQEKSNKDKNDTKNVNMRADVAKFIKSDKNNVASDVEIDNSSFIDHEVEKPKLTLSGFANTDMNRDKEGTDTNDDMKHAGKKPKAIRKRKPEMIVLRDYLRRILSNCGEIKDEDGNAIDLELIKTNLDKIKRKALRQLKTTLIGVIGSTARPEAVSLLSELHTTYKNKEVLYTTELLSSDQVEAQFLKRRENASYVAAKHKCDLCYRGFKHGNILEHHVKTHHDEAAAHACPMCRMRFRAKRTCDTHIYNHKIIFRCKLCPRSTKFIQTMVHHYNNVHRGLVYTCKICSKRYKSQRYLSGHTRSAHRPRHTCGVCARALASRAALLRHTNRNHPDEVSILENAEGTTCEQCNVTFINEQVYRVHVGRSHGGKVNSQYVVKTRGTARKPNFTCRVCNVTEHSYPRMALHYKKQHPTEKYEVYNYICHVCGKGYSTITALNEHKNNHTGAKPYACDLCRKTFTRKSCLKTHMEHHLPPQRPCKHCGKMFMSAANLSAHMRSHISDRRYICSDCGKSFNNSRSLSRHEYVGHQHIHRKRNHTHLRTHVQQDNT